MNTTSKTCQLLNPHNVIGQITVRIFFNLLCNIYKVPLYVIFVGGVKGVRYVMPEVMVNPILSDSFGFSDEKTSLFFLIIVLCNPIGTALL